MRLLIFALSLCVMSSCATAGPKIKRGTDAALDCAKTDLTQLVASAGPTVLEQVAIILAGGKPDYRAELDKLSAVVQADAVDCATKAAVAVFSVMSPARALTGGAVTPDQAADRGRTYLQAKGYPLAPIPSIAPPAALPPPKSSSACSPNLCWMDSYCSCHGDGDARRCWTTDADCDVDAKCCASGGDCHGMQQDRCTAATTEARKKS